MDRLGNIDNHFSVPWSNPIASTSPRPPQPCDVVVCCAVRTPITRAQKGGLAGAFPEDLLAPLFKEVIKRTRLDPKRIQDIAIGNVLQTGSGAVSSRIAHILGGVPNSVPIHTVNRQCSSGLQAIANVAGAIRAGYVDVGLAGGVESMTHFDMASTLNPEKLSESVFQDEQARNCLLPMGITSEILAEQYGVSRSAQDELAVESHRKAAFAQDHGLFDEEIVPVPVKGKVVKKDDGIRRGTDMVTLRKLKASFKEGGSTTAGNSSQVSDGAALVLLARRSAAEALKIPILARFLAFAVVGVPPQIMGIGPSLAIPVALQQAKISMGDVDVFELNEAFGSQAVYCVDCLKIPRHKLNPKGGAIALGHPLGATGARQVATLLPELKRTGGRFGVVSMCIGTGMGAAAVIENLQ